MPVPPMMAPTDRFGDPLVAVKEFRADKLSLPVIIVTPGDHVVVVIDLPSSLAVSIQIGSLHHITRAK